jgi:bifunctional non-homologous end joining protein LigD
MGLAEYKRKRRFERTPEPRGRAASGRGRSFVVQKHAASHLHYDFRLEMDGVLKSWAVPKGPSLDPAVKRLAVEVEDHPVEYGTFEGTIPQGEYGGGTVMLWDRGQWKAIGEPRAGYRQGKLKFELRGEKLHGGFTLVRRHGGSKGAKDKRPTWLLIKARDEFARPESEGDILSQQPRSVATGRDLESIAAGRRRTTGRAGGVSPPVKVPAPPPRQSARTGVKTGMPEFIPPQLATLTDEAPDGDEWLHEIKFDGYRMQCRIERGHARFISRNRQDWTQRLSVLAADVLALPVQQAVLDGEVVAMRGDGTTDFQALQNAFQAGRTAELRYYVFDLLHLDGQSLVQLPLEQRKKLLGELLANRSSTDRLLLSEHVIGSGREFARLGCHRQLEGIVSKRRDRPYRSGRGLDWLKTKCLHREEFVIGGYTNPSGARAGFGALLVGYFDQDRRLRYAGKVGTGFDDATLRQLHERLRASEQARSPFVDQTRAVGPARGAHWVHPTLVAQIEFGNWTRDGRLRHPSFKGLREDKPAAEVVRDRVLPLAAALHENDGSVQRSISSRAARSRARSNTVRTKSSEAAGQYDARKQQLGGVRLTSPDKVLYPEQGITKLELANYYRAVADWILPHLADRPAVLVRCPDGRRKACFYQKHPGPGTPPELRQFPIREKSKTEPYVIVDDADGLIALAQIGALEVHAWGSRADNIERPDRLIFDLDPEPAVSWKDVVAAAREVRSFLQELGLETFLKTTGGKGLHLVAPIERRHAWDEVKSFCKTVAESIASIRPDRYTATLSKAARRGKIYIDYLRNARGATAVAPYSPRSREGAPVSVPVTWNELSVRLRSDQFTIRNLDRRLSRLKADPWEGMGEMRQSLATPIRLLREARAS